MLLACGSSYTLSKCGRYALPSPALREREGPAAQRWEGEGRASHSAARASVATSTNRPGGRSNRNARS